MCGEDGFDGAMEWASPSSPGERKTASRARARRPEHAARNRSDSRKLDDGGSGNQVHEWVSMAPPLPIRRWTLTSHARDEAARRGIAIAVIESILQSPDQRFPVRTGRDVVQSRILFGRRVYLVRVFVDVDRDPPEVETAYRSSRIGKYWRNEP